MPDPSFGVSQEIPERLLKALEWTKEWTTWMVGIQSGLLAGIFALKAKQTGENAISIRYPRAVHLALGCLLASTVTATMTLNGIPRIVQSLTPEKIRTVTNVFDCLVSFWFGEARLWVMQTVQHFLLFISMLCFVIGLKFEMGKVTRL